MEDLQEISRGIERNEASRHREDLQETLARLQRQQEDLRDLAAADQILGELDVTANGHVEEATRLRQQYIALCHKAIGISALNDS